ncbi:hypothetical protein GCWU000341_01107 [Oribacterium sp. oral taxon 078 str. F0262]|nr:hypothetical protein GCWU000341_01107 [Oribacterium sp. oral taxon 078 str. F0262]
MEESLFIEQRSGKCSGSRKSRRLPFIILFIAYRLWYKVKNPQCLMALSEPKAAAFFQKRMRKKLRGCFPSAAKFG